MPDSAKQPENTSSMGLPAGQFLHDIVPADIPVRHDHHQVIEIIRDLIDDLVGTRILGGDDDL
jgi:hypothetical protein